MVYIDEFISPLWTERPHTRAAKTGLASGCKTLASSLRLLQDTCAVLTSQPTRAIIVPDVWQNHCRNAVALRHRCGKL